MKWCNLYLKRLFFRFVLKIHALTAALKREREREMFVEDESKNEKTPGPLLATTTTTTREEAEEVSFDLVWQRKLARRAEEKAEREKKRREKLERKLVKQSEENERLRWEVARAKRAMRTMAREIERRGNSDDEKEEEDEGNDHREEEMVAVLEKLAACDEDEDVSTSGETREGEGEQGNVMLVLDDEKDAEYFWSVNEDGRMNEDARPGRDRCVVVSAREEGLVNTRTTTATRRISSPLKELNVSSRVKLPNRRINVKLQCTKT